MTEGTEKHAAGQPLHREYAYHDDAHSGAHQYLLQPVIELLGAQPGVSRVLDVGCGNGSFSRALANTGLDVYGLDVSDAGIEFAIARGGSQRFRRASAYDDYSEAFQDVAPFDAIVSVEVIEHLFSPVRFAARALHALRPGGTLVLTTPYHGYAKNLALALTGKLDDHFTALWEGGHIKFWSKRTLRKLLADAGFVDVHFRGAGRLPYLWKSMVVSARKPA